MSTRRYSDMKAAEEAASSENLHATPGSKAVPHKKSRVSDSPRSSRTTGPRTPLGDVSNSLSKAFNDTLGDDPNASTGSPFLQSPSMVLNAMNHSSKFEPLFSDMSALDDSATQPGRSLFDEIKEENPESSMLGSATPLYDTLNFDNGANETVNYAQNDTMDFMGLGKTPEPGEPEDLDVTLEADEVQVEVNGEVVVAEMSMLKVQDEVSAMVEVQLEAGGAGDAIDVKVQQEKGLEAAEEVILDVKVEVNGASEVNVETSEVYVEASEVPIETSETPFEDSEVPVETSEAVEPSEEAQMTTPEPSEPTPTTPEVKEVPDSEAQTEATVTPDEFVTPEAPREPETIEQTDALLIETAVPTESMDTTATKEPETVNSADKSIHEPESMDITVSKVPETIESADKPVPEPESMDTTTPKDLETVETTIPVQPIETTSTPESMDITATSLVFPSEDRPTTPTSDAFVTPKMSPVQPEATTTTTDAPSQPRGLGVSAFSPDVSLSVSGLGFNMEASDHSFLTSHRPSSENDITTAQKILNFNNESESANSSINASGSQSPQINDSIVSFLGHEIKVHSNLDNSMAMRSVSELQHKTLQSMSEVAKLRSSNDELVKQLMEHNEIEARLKIDLEHAKKDSEDWKLLYDELMAKNAKQRGHMKPIQDEALAEQLEELNMKLASEAHIRDEYRKETMQLRNTVAELTATLQTVEQSSGGAAELKALKEQFDEVNVQLAASLETVKQFDEEIRKLHEDEVIQNALIEELRKDVESKKHVDEESKKLKAKLAELGIEDVSKVLTKLDALSKELAEKNASIDEMYTEIHNLERAKQTINDKMEAMKEELEQAKVAAARVQFVESTPILDTAALEAANAETAALKTQLASVQEEIATITASRDSAIAQIEAFKAQLDSITVNSQMEQFEGTLNLKLDQLADQNNAHISKIDALKSKFAEQNHEIANLRATVAHYESAFKEQEDEADAKQGEHMATINKLKVELGAATDSLNTLSAENSKLTSVVQEANTKIATLEEARQSSEAFLVEANALLVEKSELQAAQKARLDEIDAEIAAIRTGYQKELDGAQKKFADNLECYQMLNAQIAEKDAKIGELQAELAKVSTEAEAENESNVNALNKMQMELIEAKEKLDEARQFEERLAELQAESTQKEAELADVKRQLETVQSTVTELNAEVDLKNAKINALQAEVESATTQMATGANQEQVDELKAEVAQKEAQIAAITAELEGKKAQYVEVETENDVLKTSVVALQDSLEAARAQAAAATTLEERVSELETKLVEASQQYETVSAENATLQASINTLEADFATAQATAAEASTLKDRVAELEVQLAEAKSLESDVTTLKKRISELESELADAKSLAEDSSTLQDRISELELQLADARNIELTTSALKDRVTELESELTEARSLASASSTLQNRVSELQSQLAEARTLESAAKTDLLEQKASLDGLKAVSADLRQRVETLTNQKTDLEVSRREALAQKTEAEQQLAQIRVDLEEQYQAKETELTNAATSLKAELESKATRISDLQREVTELRDQVLELETRELEQTITIPPMAPIADKIREAVAAQFNPMRAELQAKVDQLINEKAELQTKMEIMQAKYARGKVVYQQLREERNTLREKLQKQTALTEASTNTDEVTTTSSSTAADPAEIERLQARITAYKEQIGKLNDELDSTDDKMEGLMKQIFQRTVQMNELKRRLGDTDIEPVTSMEGM